MTIAKDKLVGAKTYPTVKKRLNELKVRILKFDMVITKELFDALTEKETDVAKVIGRKSEPFRLR